MERHGNDTHTRNMLFFFAGGVQMTDMLYSGGARQVSQRPLDVRLSLSLRSYLLDTMQQENSDLLGVAKQISN
jgi:hypothetical protein